MYSYDNMDRVKNQIIKDSEKLSDVGKTGKERPWRVHKLNTIRLAESYERLGIKKHYRLADCGSFLEFRDYGFEMKLNRSNFCKVRLCPMCSWRRSLKIFGQVSKVMDQALVEKEYRFLFLTLTCKNVEGERLSETLDLLFKSYVKLMRRKKVKKAVKGWFRALEVTHNLDRYSTSYDTYHPHFHIVLMVNKSYFNDSSSYISHSEWVELWKSCMSVDYSPNVDIKAFKSNSKEITAKSVSEVAKYTVKSSDIIVKKKDGSVDEKLTDSAVFILDNALAHRRLVAFGGVLKDIHKALKLDDVLDGDLVNTDNDDVREDLAYNIIRFKWNIGYKQYIKL